MLLQEKMDTNCSVIKAELLKNVPNERIVFHKQSSDQSCGRMKMVSSFETEIGIYIKWDETRYTPANQGEPGTGTFSCPVQCFYWLFSQRVSIKYIGESIRNRKP